MTTISFITSITSDESLKLLRSTVDSLVEQTSSDWQLCIATQPSASGDARGELHDLSRRDNRISAAPGFSDGHAASANEGLAIANGELVALVDPGDLLAKGAVAALEQTLSEHPSMDYCYSDEVSASSDGRLTAPFYKPDWSPERMRAQFFTGRLSAMKRTAVLAAGGFRPEFDPCFERELCLRVSETATEVVHLPAVLYVKHVRESHAASPPDPVQTECERRAIQQHCQRVGIDAAVEPLERPGNYRIRRRLRSRPLVSIVIPTRGAASLIRQKYRTLVVHALSSIIDRSTYQNLEFVVVADRDTPSSVIRQLEELCGDRLRIEWWTGPFNFSAKVNVGVAASSGPIVVLLNDDIEVLTPDWIETLIGLVEEPDCGLVGCKLLTASGTLQHGGHVFASGEILHAYANYPGDEEGMGDLLLVDRECAGVTAACASLRRDVFDQVGGMCESLPINYNDVDLALKVRGLGHRVIWTPHAVLYHFESRTRVQKNEVSSFESQFVKYRWQTELEVDPYSNPNLDQSHGDWVVARPAEFWLL